jgi:ribulose-phosphate 3-epimerase
VKIAPSILSSDFGRLAEEIQTVEAGGADWIHVDVMDGHFVPNITIGPVVVEGARRATRLPLDVHLMIEDPDRYLEAFVDAGADVLTVHAEACRHLHRTLQRIRQLGAKAGVALNPGTPLSAVEEIASGLDLLLVMSVNPGFGGQAFIPASVDKVARARDLLDAAGSTADIEVDGGVDATNAAVLVDAGATVLVAGSAVYGHPEGPGAGVRSIRSARTS